MAPSSNTSTHLFIRSVSPLANEQSVRDFFKQAKLYELQEGRLITDDLSLETEQERLKNSHPSGETVADDIVSVKFLKYPKSIQRYCQIEFKSSAGVTSAMALNGKLLHSVTTTFSVINPSILSSSSLKSDQGAQEQKSGNPLLQALSPAALTLLLQEAEGPTSGMATSAQVQTIRSILLSAGCLTPDQVNIVIQASAISAVAAKQQDSAHAAAQTQVLQAIVKSVAQVTGGNIDILATLAAKSMPRESEEKQLKRTLIAYEIPWCWDVSTTTCALRDMLSLGSVVELRLDYFKNGVRFALVEFTSTEAVETALEMPKEKRTMPVLMPGVKTDQLLDPDEQVTIKFERSKVTVRPHDPEDVSFTVHNTSLTPVPIAYQTLSKLTLEEKLRRVKELAEKIVEEKKKEKVLSVLKFKRRRKDQLEKTTDDRRYESHESEPRHESEQRYEEKA